TRCSFSPQSIRTAAEHLRVKWSFESVTIGGIRALAEPGKAEQFHKALWLLRRKTSEQGCVNIQALASELKLGKNELEGITHLFARVTGAAWLDDRREWLYLASSPRNRLLNICAKILGVVESIHLTELRRAV